MAKKKSRANGEDSVFKNTRNGKLIGWRGAITIGRYENGRLKRKEFTGKTQESVIKKMNDYKSKMINSSFSVDNSISLSQWYYEWLYTYKKNEYKPKSFERYDSFYKNYIKDTEIGLMKLSEIRTENIQRYINKLTLEKSPSLARSFNTRLKPCLSDAERRGYIEKNWCKLVILPKLEKKEEVEILSKEQQSIFIKEIENHKYEMLFLIALGTGLRLGELLGLKWSDIDFKNNTITVNRTIQRIKNQDTGKYELTEQTPKTKNSKGRIVPIPNDLVSKLIRYRDNQIKHISEIKDIYKDSNYVFCNELGIPLDDKLPGRNLKSILNKLNIKPVKFHALRHTYITRLFELNVPVKVISELVGHVDIQTTLNIYTHVNHDLKFEAADKLNGFFIDLK